MNNKINIKNIKSKKVRKRNGLIQSDMSDYNLIQLKFINSFYYNIQQNINSIKENYIKNNNKYIYELPFIDVAEMMGINNTNKYNDIIKENLSILRDNIELKNYSDDKDIKWDWIQLSLCDKLGVKKEYTNKLICELDDQFIYQLELKKNYTELNILFMSKIFKRRNEYVLYEYLKSIEKKDKKFIVFTLEELNKLLCVNKKHLAHMKPTIMKLIDTINDKTDINIKINYNKQKKHIILIFNEIKKESPIDNKFNFHKLFIDIEYIDNKSLINKIINIEYINDIYLINTGNKIHKINETNEELFLKHLLENTLLSDKEITYIKNKFNKYLIS